MKKVIQHIEELIRVYEVRKKQSNEKSETDSKLYWNGRNDAYNTTLIELRGIHKLLTE